jgi:hypothetical protein
VRPPREEIRLAIVESFPSREEQLALQSTVGAAARAGLREGASLFDARRFWDAHEAWEDIWQVERRPIRSFYQGLIQLAAGFHHWTVTLRPGGVQILLGSGIEKLEWYQPSYLGIDVGAMIDDARRMRAIASGRDAAWLQAFDPAQLPRLRWLSLPPNA